MVGDGLVVSDRHAGKSCRPVSDAGSAAHRARESLRRRRPLPPGDGDDRTLGVSRLRRPLERDSDAGARHGQPLGVPVRYRRRAGRPTSTRRLSRCGQVVRDAGPQRPSVDSDRGDLQGGTSRPAARPRCDPDADVGRRWVASQCRLVVVGLLAAGQRALRLDGSRVATGSSTPLHLCALDGP